jgi:hypothetical protein
MAEGAGFCDSSIACFSIQFATASRSLGRSHQRHARTWSREGRTLRHASTTSQGTAHLRTLPALLHRHMPLGTPWREREMLKRKKKSKRGASEWTWWWNHNRLWYNHNQAQLNLRHASFTLIYTWVDLTHSTPIGRPWMSIDRKAIPQSIDDEQICI